MWDIFKAEGLRYRAWTLLYAGVHVLVLGFLSRVSDLAQQPLMVYRIIGGWYALSGILLGLHQMGTYRLPHAWLNLLHRPVAAKRIAMALLLAGALLVVVGIVLPIVMVVAYQALGTARVVDGRHQLFPLAAGLIAICGYLAGAYGALADRRYSACALVFLAWIAVSEASGAAAILVQGLAAAWLVAMVLVAFRPDLGEPPRTVAATVLTALPVQVGVYLVMLSLGFAGEILWIMQGTHPTNMGTPPRGGFVETERMSERDRMLAGLAGSDAPDAPLWREQVALSEVFSLGRQVRAVPVRGELTNTVPMAFDDEAARIHWVFSHRRMRYEGYSLADGRSVGELGVGTGNQAFAAPATVAGVLPGLSKGDVAIASGSTLYQYMARARRIVPRIHLPDGETLLGTTPVGGSLAVVGNRTIGFYDTRHLADGEDVIAPRQRLVMPGKVGDLARAEAVELVDGYLIDLTFSWRAYSMLGTSPYQSVIHLDDGGRAVPVATRTLAPDFPAFYRYKAWWSSPVMYALRHAATGWFGTPDPTEETAPPPVPDGIRMLAVGLALLSLLGGAWLAWRRALSWPARIAWIVVCGTVGVPAVVALRLIVPRRDSPVPLVHPMPSAA